MFRRFETAKLLRWAQWGGAVAALTIAALIIFNYYRHRQALVTQVHEQHRIMMGDVRQQVEDYFRRVRVDLLFISLDNDVQKMSRDSYDYIAAIYEGNYELYQMAEIYIMKRDFDGSAPPFMVFEHDVDDQGELTSHDLEIEKYEYAEQMDHIRRFAEDPSLSYLASHLLPLCADSKGIVISVPIRKDGALVGIVAAMVPVSRIAAVIELGRRQETFLLINERKDIIAGKDFPPALKVEIEDLFRNQSVGEYFADQGEQVVLGSDKLYWTDVDIAGGNRWYLLHTYDEAQYLAASGLAGGYITWAVVMMVLINGCGAIILCGVARALHQARRQAEDRTQELSESETRVRAILDTAADGVITINEQGIIETFNDKAEYIFGYARKEVIGENVNMLMPIPPGQAHDGCLAHYMKTGEERGIGRNNEVMGLRKDGTGVALNLSVSQVTLGGRPLFTGIVRDITREKETEQQLRHHATHDKLTGLANRAVLMERLEAAISRNRPKDNSVCAVLFLDFDRFKLINDSLGHQVGDQLLIQIAQRLTQSLQSSTDPSGQRYNSTVARIGGDEFVILLEAISDLTATIIVVKRLEESLSAGYQLEGHEVVSTASIGIVLSEHAQDKPDDLLRDADTAMYQAKTLGKARYEVFDKAMHFHVTMRMKMESDLRKALEQNQLLLNYQPLVALETGELTGFEALLRWEHPQLGRISPDQFIPIAEETGLIIPIGQWVLEQACRQLRHWQQKFDKYRDLTMAVNVSRAQLVRVSLAQQVQNVLKENDLEPHCVHLEVTESVMMEDAHSLQQSLWQLKELGIPLHMDDFGTGQSSLSQLHQLPIQALKIDRSFVMNMGDRREYPAIVQAIIELAHNLNLAVVAEGTETPEQVAQLQALDCDMAQGYFFAKPMAADEAEILLGGDVGLARTA